MHRENLEKSWTDRAMKCRLDMKRRRTIDIRTDTTRMVYEARARAVRNGSALSELLLECWRNAEQAHMALGLRGELERPDLKNKWGAMLEANNQCVRDLVPILHGC